MNEKKLLIAGIDPGTTTGYAVLDIDGNLIYTGSSKQLDLNSLISEIIKLGKVILAGTDKSKIPNLVSAFATKVGAKIAKPNEDLKIDEKRKMTLNYNFYDEHQGDALASALFAYKSYRQLLDKIDFFVNKNQKHNIKNKIKEMVITKGISIKSAVSIIEKKAEKAPITSKDFIERKLTEKDFSELQDKLRRYENEIKLMRRYNSDLINRIKNLEKINTHTGIKSDENVRDFREKRIKILESSRKFKDREIEKLRFLIKKLNDKITNINRFYIMKKLDTLGLKEYEFKNKILNIEKNDIILVNEPNILSNETIGLLEDKIFIIVHKKPVSKKIENKLPFIFLSADKLKIDETEYFGFVEKQHFEIEKNKIDWVGKIVSDYRNTKENLIIR